MHHLIRMPTKAVKKFGGVVNHGGKSTDDLDFGNFMRNGRVVLPSKEDKIPKNVPHCTVAFPSLAQHLHVGDKLPTGDALRNAAWWVEFIIIESARSHAILENPEAFCLALGEASRLDERHKYDVQWLTVCPCYPA